MILGQTKTPGTLLLVDDEPDIREMLALILSDITPNIDEAENGSEALEKTKLKRYDAIISDVKMPKKDGMQLLADLRKMSNQTPFVILTGHGDKETAVEALKRGAFDFIDKPFREEALMSTVRKAIELGQEINRITDSKNSLEDFRKEVAEHSSEKLVSIIRNLTEENRNLRKKVDGNNE